MSQGVECYSCLPKTAWPPTSKSDIERLLDSKVKLNVWVKVRKEWRDNPLFLKELGYNNRK